MEFGTIFSPDMLLCAVGAVFLYPSPVPFRRLSYVDFTKSAQAFLQHRLTAEDMLDLCATALATDAADDDNYAYTVCSYKFLAHRALRQYGEAIAEAHRMTEQFDALRGCQMLSDIYLRRRNYHTALEYVRKTEEIALAHNIDATELEAEKRDIAHHIACLITLEAGDLAARAAYDAVGTRRAFQGRELLITGTVLPSPGLEPGPLLVLEAAPPIRCAPAASEIPFLRDLAPGSRATVLGLLEYAGDEVFLSPCYVQV